MPKRLLVTGAAGFIGANLTRRWVDDGHDVVAAMNPESNAWRLDGVTCTRELIDVTDGSVIDAMFDRVRPEVVINTAAHGAYSSQQDLARMLSVNVYAVERLAGACLRSGVPLLHLGSSSEYGEVDHPPQESEVVSPNSNYAISKVAGTHMVGDAVRRGLVAAVFRLYSVYGQWEEPTRLMPTLACHVRAGTLPPLVEPGIARDFVHVDDVVNAATRWIVDPITPGPLPILNIGTGVQTTIAELVEIARTELGVEAEPRWGSMPNRSWDTSCWVADAAKARHVLGWQPAVDITSGLRALVDFVAVHADRYEVKAATNDH